MTPFSIAFSAGSSKAMTRRGALGALSLAAALALSACSKSDTGEGAKVPGTFKAVDITGANYANRLQLPDPEGKLRSLEEFKGKVVIVFFGFTQCPDVCPTVLNDIAQMRKGLGADGAKVQPIFVTVDPTRDTPELLKAYAASFGDDVLALRGDDQQTKAAAQEFKVFYARVPGKTADSYTIDHTAGAWVFDAKGRVRLFMRHGQTPAEMQADVARLLAGA